MEAGILITDDGPRLLLSMRRVCRHTSGWQGMRSSPHGMTVASKECHHDPPTDSAAVRYNQNLISHLSHQQTAHKPFEAQAAQGQTRAAGSLDMLSTSSDNDVRRE